MSPDLWDPAAYERFKAQRDLPFFDLVAMLKPCPGGRALDLGCGTGELTKKLHEHLGALSTLGIDNSATMLARSASFAGNGLSFQEADILQFRPPDSAPLFDVIFSNAALHFMPGEQAELFRHVSQWVAPGGQLAVHLPANHEHPSQTIAVRVASESPFREALGGWYRQSPVLAPERYAEILHDLGYHEQTVRLEVYGHELPDREEVITWVRSSMLTEYQKRMPAELFESFLNRYRELLLPELDARRPSFFTFRRILLRAAK